MFYVYRHEVHTAYAPEVSSSLAQKLTSGSIHLLGRLQRGFHLQLRRHVQAPRFVRRTTILQATCEYIQRWTLLRNSVARISEDNTIYAFTRGVYRLELKEALGRVKPKTIAHPMQIANEWADGEDSICNERSGTPVEAGDQGSWSRRNNDRRCKQKA